MKYTDQCGTLQIVVNFNLTRREALTDAELTERIHTLNLLRIIYEMTKRHGIVWESPTIIQLCQQLTIVRFDHGANTIHEISGCFF